MYLTLHADTAGGIVQRNNASRWSLPRRDFRPRWRSMVTSLSPTGLDLSNDDFLEFWLFQPAGEPADSAGMRLVIDLGTVSEDAMAMAPDSLTANGADTLYTGRQYVGLGTLNTERTDIGIFNAETDDIGILGDRPDSIQEAGLPPVEDLPLCVRALSSEVPVFPWGDLSSRCTNGNGVARHRGPERRHRSRPHGLQRERLPLRRGSGRRQLLRPGRRHHDRRTGPHRHVEALPHSRSGRPSKTLNTPTLRLVQHLRLTVVAPPDPGQPDIVARFAMARLRFVGSPWVRRSETPILGLTGATGEPHGEIVTSVVSTENQTDLGYESPPGVTDDVARRGGDQQSEGTQINEKSLRIIAQDLRLGERAEAYLRFPAGAQNLLTYRTLGVWMRGRGPGWNEGDLQAFLKLGSDNNNFYLYRAPATLRYLDARGDDRPRDAAAASGRRRESLAQRSAAVGRRRVRHPGHRGVRGLRGALSRACRRPRGESTEPRGGAGDLGRHLPGGPDGHHGGGGAVGGRHPAQPIPSPRPARPRRSTRGSSPRTWPRCRSRTSSRTASSGRSTRIRPTWAPTCSSWRQPPARALPAHQRSGSRCR